MDDSIEITLTRKETEFLMGLLEIFKLQALNDLQEMEKTPNRMFYLRNGIVSPAFNGAVTISNKLKEATEQCRSN